MKTPTTEEIQRAYDKITEDGPGAPITMELAVLTTVNPLLKNIGDRQTTAVIQLALMNGDPGLIKSALMGALIYGLHLGMHIGEGRQK